MGAVLDLVRVLYEPTAVFERVREKPRFLAPFVALAFAIVLIGVVQLPYTKAAMSAQFSQMPNMTPEAAQRALSFVSIGVATYASMSYILLTLVGLAVLRMRGTEQIAGMEDLQPALGLDLLAPGAKGLTLALLRGINPFSLYGIFLTATGISVTHKTSKGSAYTAAIVQLLVTLLVTGVLSGMRGGR